jgi:hypothetical protein
MTLSGWVFMISVGFNAAARSVFVMKEIKQKRFHFAVAYSIAGN